MIGSGRLGPTRLGGDDARQDLDHASSMHRRELLDKLGRYAARHPDEREVTRRMLAFVERRADCLLRSSLEGHVTASAWIASPDRARVLLVHHRKLGRWLQPGGHADGDADTLAVALREAHEECGLEGLVAFADEPLDLDIHGIPARPGEPAHLHYDVRFLLLAPSDGPLVQSDESHALRWFAHDAPEIASEESLARLARKARPLLSRGAG
jgi:8-oxo-dGTP pyrophosphatase MutT (NUDIX family)